MRRLAAIGVGAIGLVALAAAGLAGSLVVLDSPLFAWRVLVDGESDIGDWRIFPSRPIARPASASALPQGPAFVPPQVTTGTGEARRTESLDALLARTGTHAFLIVQHDRLVLELYPNGAKRDDVNTSFSAAKAFDATLIGAAIADGKIGSLGDPVIRYVPELAGRGLDALTLRDLLLMNSGVSYVHNSEMPFYMAPFGDDARTYYSADLRRVALSVRPSATPIGAAFKYNNFYPLLEGLVLERATGMHVADYLAQRIWQPMGAEFDASWSLDSDADGFEKMESGINARAVDFARFGLLYLHDGVWNGRRILPEAWVREATMPLDPDPRPWQIYPAWPTLGGYYKYHWWGLSNADGSHDFVARGKFEQLIYVAPRKDAVVVRLGDQPDSSLNWPLTIRSLVDQLPG